MIWYGLALDLSRAKMGSNLIYRQTKDLYVFIFLIVLIEKYTFKFFIKGKLRLFIAKYIIALIIFFK